MITLRRITSSQTYLPYIDGLRFFTILPVILVHYVDFYEQHTYPVRTTAFYQRLHLDSAIGNSENSLLFFFAISGFILGMPFAKSLLNHQPYPKLGAFYLRRITRLEPPYLLLLTALLLLNVFVIHRDTLSDTLPHYLASFFYVHNIIFESHPTLNFVFWTLEIEVQFYLLAPFLAYVFKIEKVKRRYLLVLVMLLFGILNHYYHPPFLSLFNFLHYFIGGFLALDLFLQNQLKKHYFWDVLCITLAYSIYTSLVTYGITLAFMISLLIALTPQSILWEKIITLKWITLLGGMCYSLYMIHHPAMAVFLNRFVGNSVRGGSVGIDFTIKLIAVLMLVLLISTIFFLAVERPCMKKDWYRRFFTRIHPGNH